MIQSYLFIGPSERGGRGVFTSKNIAANTIVEIAPVVVMSGEERKLLDQTLLHDYIFEWGAQNNQCAMALGWIPMYNHAVPSNCEYFMNFDDDTMFVKTVREIAMNEELTINYNGNFADDKGVWFQMKE